jgi:hypothetical protein
MSKVIIEVTLFEAQNLKPIKGRTSDPYVLLSSSSLPKRKYKSMRQATEDPKWNEVFFIETTSTITKNKLNDTLALKVMNFASIGKPNEMGNVDIALGGMNVGELKTDWYDLVRGGQIRVSIQIKNVNENDLPPAFANKKGFYRSVTRATKRAENKERQDTDKVDYLSIVVHEGVGLMVSNSDGTSNPYLFINLNSSKMRRKSKILKKTTNPKWEQTFGFQLNNVVNDVILDGLNFDVFGFNLVGRASPLGKAFYELNGIKLGDTIDATIPIIHNKQKQGELKCTLSFTQKTWSEVQAEDSSLIDSMNRKLIYMISSVKKKLSERGLECELSISIRLVVIEVRMALIITADPLETLDNAADELGEDALDDLGDTDDANTTQEPGVVKRALMRNVDKMLNGLAQTRERMSKLGLEGRIGASVIAAAFGCEINIGVDVTLKSTREE